MSCDSTYSKRINLKNHTPLCRHNFESNLCHRTAIFFSCYCPHSHYHLVDSLWRHLLVISMLPLPHTEKQTVDISQIYISKLYDLCASISTLFYQQSNVKWSIIIVKWPSNCFLQSFIDPPSYVARNVLKCMHLWDAFSASGSNWIFWRFETSASQRLADGGLAIDMALPFNQTPWTTTTLSSECLYANADLDGFPIFSVWQSPIHWRYPTSQSVNQSISHLYLSIGLTSTSFRFHSLDYRQSLFAWPQIDSYSTDLQPFRSEWPGLMRWW